MRSLPLRGPRAQPHLRFPTRPWSRRCSRALSRRRLSSLVNVPSECRGALGRGWRRRSGSGPGRGRGGGRRRAGKLGPWSGVGSGTVGSPGGRGARGGALEQRRQQQQQQQGPGGHGGRSGWLSAATKPEPRATLYRGARRGVAGGGLAGGVSTAPAPRSPGRSPSIRRKVRATPAAVAPAGRPSPAPRRRPSAGWGGKAGLVRRGGGAGERRERLCTEVAPEGRSWDRRRGDPRPRAPLERPPAGGARGWAEGRRGRPSADRDLTATRRGGRAAGRAQIRAWGPRHLFSEAGET